MHNTLHDLRYAFRQLRRSPGFTVTAVLILALGIGANTAIFSLVYQVLLRSLPVAHPEQIYKIGKGLDCCVDAGARGDWKIFSYDMYQSLRDHTPGVDGMAAVQAGSLTFSVRRAGSSGSVDAAQPLSARFVSGNYFPVLGVPAFAGRLLQPGDNRKGSAPVAVISYSLWQTRFAGDPHLLGSTLLLTGHPVTVVGIAAETFLGERNETNPPGIWLPLVLEPELQPDRKLMLFPGEQWLDLLVRLNPPSQAPKVQTALRTELSEWIQSHREYFPGISDRELAEQTTELAPVSTGMNDLGDQYQPSLRLLLLASGSVLLIACANLGILMLARSMGRRGEMAIRSALGAPQARLIGQTLVESLLLALAGGAAGIGLAYAGTHAMLALALKGVELSPLKAAPPWPVLGFALALSLVTGVLFGLLPAWIGARLDPADTLRSTTRSPGDASASPQRFLVILQAALSLTLLSAAGLLIVSLRHLQQQDFHFTPEGRLIVFTDLQSAGYTYEHLAALYRQLDDTFARLPEVERFAYATYGPMAYNRWSTGVFFPYAARSPAISAYSAVSANYFATVGTPVLLGRGIDAQDTATSVHVAVVNRSFVNEFLQGRQAIGEHFGPDPSLRGAFQIVGVVADTKYGSAERPAEPMFFTPLTQTTVFPDPKDQSVEDYQHFPNNLIVQYRGDEGMAAKQVRAALQSIDPNIPILRILPYTEQLAGNFTQQDLLVRLTSLFGILALLLASVGLYGVTAYTVARRTGEIGIRMALGATRGGVLALILRGALTQVSIGLAIGVPLSIAAGRLLQHTLYQTSAFEPRVLLAIFALLSGAALIAALIPAQRAASINPTEALRAE